MRARFRAFWSHLLRRPGLLYVLLVLAPDGYPTITATRSYGQHRDHVEAAKAEGLTYWVQAVEA